MTTRRLRASALATVVALGMLLGLLPASASASDTVTVTLLAPTAGSPLSGVVTVSLRVVAPADWGVNRVDASVRGRGASLFVAPEACAQPCTLDLRIDTSEVEDGATTLDVSVMSDIRSGVTTSFPVVVDNHRPVLTVQRDTPEGNSVADTFGATLVPRLRDGAHVRSIAWRGVQSAPGTITPVGDVDGPWRLVLDTSRLVEGSWWTSVVLTDSLGRTTLPIDLPYVVTRTMNLSTTADFPAVVDDTDLLRVPIGFRYAKGLKDVVPRRLVVEVDGRELSRTVGFYLPIDLSRPPITGTLDAGSDVRFPAGRHRISYVVTDTRGLTNRLDLPELTIRSTAETSWTSRPPAELAVGQRGTLGAEVTTKSNQVYNWHVSSVERRTGATMSFGGSDECFPGCPTAARADSSVVFSTPGTYDVTVEFALWDSWSTRLTSTVHVVPLVSARVDATRTVAAGSRHRLTGTVRDSDGRAVRGVVADLQRRLPGRTAWSVVASATADASGRLSAEVGAPGTADYRWSTRSRAGSWAGTTGSARTVAATAAVRVTTKPTKVAKRKKASVRATATPSEAGARFELQRYDAKKKAWRLVKRVRSSASGTASFSYRPSARKTSLRVVRLGTSAAATGTSPSWTLTVRR